MGNCAVILHGGAGSVVDSVQMSREVPVLKNSLDAAWLTLMESGNGDAAVVSGLRVLEDCEYFDSGYGSFPNEEGKVRLDIGLMRGSGDFVSVVNIPRMRHPSEFARDLLESGRTVMLAWNDALELKVQNATAKTKARYGLVENEEEMIAPYALQYIRQMRAQTNHGGMLSPVGHDTVGVIVRDAEGRIFAGTSTGGTAMKPVGRVGDSPIIGAGVFADNQVMGLSATGHGETILKSMVSGYVVAEVRRKLDEDPDTFVKKPALLQSIIEQEIERMGARYANKSAGIIAIPPRGRPAFGFNSKVLPVAWRIGSKDKVEAEEVTVAVQAEVALAGNG